MDMNYTFVFLSARTFPWLGARFAIFEDAVACVI